jgi:hypothetical protein
VELQRPQLDDARHLQLGGRDLRGRGVHPPHRQSRCGGADRRPEPRRSGGADVGQGLAVAAEPLGLRSRGPGDRDCGALRRAAGRRLHRQRQAALRPPLRPQAPHPVTPTENYLLLVTKQDGARDEKIPGASNTLNYNLFNLQSSLLQS